MKIKSFDIRFKFRDCLIIISFPFLALITALLLLDDKSTLCWGLLAAFIHECGHIFAMFLKKSKPLQICFRSFSIDIIDSNSLRRDCRSDLFILFAGPLANAIAAFVLIVFQSFFNFCFLKAFALANLFLATFNLLPIEPLDGGQITLIFLLRKLKLRTAEKIALSLSFLTLFPLAAVGFFVLFHSKYNFSLLFLSCYLMAVLLLKNKNWHC